MAKIPNCDHAVVARAKVEGYLLSAAHPVGRHKARFFESFGFSEALPDQLIAALQAHCREHDFILAEATPWGMRYIIEGRLEAPDGRKPVLRSVWFIRHDGAPPTFVTAFPAGARR